MYAIIAAAVLILVFILFAPARAELSFKEKTTYLKISLFNIVIYKKKQIKDVNDSDTKTPYERAQKLEQSSKSLASGLKTYIEIFKTAVHYCNKYVSIEKLELDAKVGTGDAASTAVIVGTLWAAAYGLIGTIGSIAYIDKHEVKIVPSYTEAEFSLTSSCIFKSRIVYIIIIALTILIKIYSLKGKEE